MALWPFAALHHMLEHCLCTIAAVIVGHMRSGVFVPGKGICAVVLALLDNGRLSKNYCSVL